MILCHIYIYIREAVVLRESLSPLPLSTQSSYTVQPVPLDTRGREDAKEGGIFTKVLLVDGDNNVPQYTCSIYMILLKLYLITPHCVHLFFHLSHHAKTEDSAYCPSRR